MDNKTFIAIAMLLLIVFLSLTQRRSFKNKLRLQFLHNLEEAGKKPFRLRKYTFLTNASDEFKHIRGVFDEWEKESKNIADYVTGEEEKEALLDDLKFLIRRAEHTIEIEQSSSDRDPTRIHKRKVFIEQATNQQGKIEAWEVPAREEIGFDFVILQGFCILTFEESAIVNLEIEFQQQGIFKVTWIDAGDAQLKQEVIRREIKINKPARESIRLLQPKACGKFVIHDITNNVHEHIPA
jgi:hypothetical protein